MKAIRFLLLGCLCVLAMPELAQAQPNRQFPGGRVFLPGSPITPPGVPNSRTRPAANQVGLESTDFYPKNGYPKVLGDAVEQGSTSGGQTGGAATAGGAAGNNGVSGVQAAGSGGFQGNSGNQIGQNGGGTILGGVFGFSQLPQGGIGFGDQLRNTMGVGMTGGGFSGMVPKGFGFGGTPDWTRSWTHQPLSGSSK